jgi:hypothetical protein
MKYNLLWLVLVLALVACGQASPTVDTEATAGVEKEEAEVLQAFAAYQSALLAGDSLAALNMVDMETVQWYQDVLDQALNAPRSELNQFTFSRKYTVLRVRHELSREELEAASGEEIFVRAVNQGWIDRASVENVKLGQVQVQDGTATISAQLAAQLASQLAPEQPVFQLVKEYGQWRMALYKQLPPVDAAIEQMIAESGLSENEFIVLALEAATGLQAHESIFEGPRVD